MNVINLEDWKRSFEEKEEAATIRWAPKYGMYAVNVACKQYFEKTLKAARERAIIATRQADVSRLRR